MQKSPYLVTQNRLADVIAAIQAMSRYKFYQLDFSGWANRITGDDNNAPYWKTVLMEHPEFFRLDSSRQRASLVVRRQHQKRYHVDENRVISTEEYYALTEPEKTRVSRTPLSTEETAVLIKTAIDLRSKALEQETARRWWIPIFAAVVTSLTALVVAVIGLVANSPSP